GATRQPQPPPPLEPDELPGAGPATLPLAPAAPPGPESPVPPLPGSPSVFPPSAPVPPVPAPPAPVPPDPSPSVFNGIVKVWSASMRSPFAPVDGTTAGALAWSQGRRLARHEAPELGIVHLDVLERHFTGIGHRKGVADDVSERLRVRIRPHLGPGAFVMAPQTTAVRRVGVMDRHPDVVHAGSPHVGT